MKVIVFESEAYEKLWNDLMKKLERTLAAANQSKETEVKTTSDWVSLEEAQKLLGVKSKSKMQSLRDEGLIRFSQHGRTIRYSRKSILQFLENHAQ